VQVDVAGAGALGLGALGGLVGRGAAPVGAPPAAVGDPPDLLDVDVDHVAGVAGGDPARDAVGRPAGVDVAATVDAQADQPSRDRRGRDAVPAPVQLAADLPRGPLVIAPPAFDLLDQLDWKLGR
jgi:hypothetical protein